MESLLLDHTSSAFAGALFKVPEQPMPSARRSSPWCTP
jgi:hypothetical protein